MSDRAAVVAAYGPPAQSFNDSLGYHCRPTPTSRSECNLTFVLGVRGRLAGRLAGIVAGGPQDRFQTVEGVRIGMSVSAARKLAPAIGQRVICGSTALRSSKPEGRAGNFAGVSAMVARNRVFAIVAIAPDEPVVCTKDGGYSIGY
jgi:hypothetical protein